MFNSSLAQEMTAYIELRSAAFSDSLVSNDKRVLLSLDQYLVRAGFQEKSLTEHGFRRQWLSNEKTSTLRIEHFS